MKHEAIKLELIEWVTQLNDSDMLELLKTMKDYQESAPDWWEDLGEEQKKGIERGLKDIEEGRVVPHSEVMKKYGF